jgi:hypothetical protein
VITQPKVLDEEPLIPDLERIEEMLQAELAEA